MIITREKIAEEAIRVYDDLWADGMAHEDALRGAIEFALEYQQPTSGVFLRPEPGGSLGPDASPSQESKNE